MLSFIWLIQLTKPSPEGLSVRLIASSDEFNGALGEALAKMISEGRAPKNLRCEIGGLGYSNDRSKGKDTQFINLLCDALEKGKAPFGLFLDFAWCDLSVSEDAKLRLLNILENGNFPPQFKLNAAFLLKDDLSFQKALADILMKNTSLSFTFEGMPTPKGEEQKYLDIIRYCSQRNRLLWDFPQHADLIKKISTGAGYYNPIKERISPLSLRSYAASAFFNSKEEIENYQEALGTLPPDVVKYIQTLEGISNQMKKIFPKSK